MNPVLRGVSKFAQFDGRDTRGQFWPYAGVVMAGVILGWFAVFAVEFSRLFSAIQQPAEGGQALPNFSLLLGSMGVLVAIAVVLLAAAVTRRLHDRGLPGWIALAPLPLLAFGLYGMWQIMNDFGTSDTMPDLFFPVFINNMAYNGILLALVIILALPGQPTDNRYGPRGDAG